MAVDFGGGGSLGSVGVGYSGAIESVWGREYWERANNRGRCQVKGLGIG